MDIDRGRGRGRDEKKPVGLDSNLLRCWLHINQSIVYIIQLGILNQPNLITGFDQCSREEVLLRNRWQQANEIVRQRNKHLISKTSPTIKKLVACNMFVFQL